LRQLGVSSSDVSGDVVLIPTASRGLPEPGGVSNVRMIQPPEWTDQE